MARAKGTNFPNSSAGFVTNSGTDENPTFVLTQAGQYLLQNLWTQAYSIGPVQESPGQLAPWPPVGVTPTLAQTAAQVTLLTNAYNALLTTLTNFGVVQ